MYGCSQADITSPADFGVESQAPSFHLADRDAVPKAVTLKGVNQRD